MGSHHKKKKKTPDVNVIIADISRDQDQEASKAALQPSYEGNTYIVQSRTMIDFVNVTESIDPSQTAGGAPDVTPPATVLGLSALAASDTVINLSWTANTEPDLDHYNVYRGTVNGFTVTLGVTVPVGTPFTNSYSDTGRTASTTYYYRVSAVDTSGNIGPLSSQAQATTLTPGSILPSLELHLNSSFTDTSPNAFLVYIINSNGYILPGQFGTAGWKCNSPSVAVGNKDRLIPGSTPVPPPSPVPLQMDTSIGFSISLWVNPQDISALGMRRLIMSAVDDTNNKWALTLDSSGICYFNVRKAGIDYKAQVSGFTTGAWQHIGATFNGATNSALVYRNAVVGTSSVATAEYNYDDPTFAFMVVGVNYLDQDLSYYAGYYDEIRYYRSVVLTPTQITNLKNTNAP